MTASPLVLTVALFALGALLMALAHRRRHAPVGRRREDWVKYAVYLALIGGLLGAASLGRWLVGLALAALVVGGAVEAGRALGRCNSARTWAARVLAALLLAASWGHMLLGPAGTWPRRFAFLVLVTSSTDAFAQLWGMLLGTRKLCPRLSPAKTREGMLGGIGTALAVALGAGFLDAPPEATLRACVGLLTAAAAFGGDLLFSLLKRRAGIKDFSRVLPGHGGILDRFDSMTLAAPVFHWSRAILGG
jgi:phosphatidate cytidylyltransferase